MNSSPLQNGRLLPDSQSWNSSGSDEDLEAEPGPGPHGGVVEFSGVLSKVRQPCKNLARTGKACVYMRVST